jgi:carboxyl-terminal processing protease
MSESEKLTLLSMKMPRRRFLVAFMLAVTLAAGAILERWLIYASMPSSARSDFKVIAQAWNVIYRNYVDRGAIDSSVLAHRAIEAMTDALGDTNHSTFLSKQMLNRADTAMNGKFTGIGIEVETRKNQPVIVAALDGSPALRAGLRPGEIITAVDGHPVAGMRSNQIFNRIAGPAGQAVKLTLRDPRSGRSHDVSVVRSSFKVNNVTWIRIPGTDIAHLRLSLFSDGVAKEFRQALIDIQHQGMTNVILDLRDNPGGVLEESVGIASQFLDKGNVLLEKHADGKITPVPVIPGGVAENVRLAVLINGLSASASEIIAGAMQDADRAKLIGEKTFGTGTVLTQFPLSDGSALLLAVEEWLTPRGRSFWHKHIEPDITVAEGNVIPLRPTTEGSMGADEFRAYGDQQLLFAVDMLEGKKALAQVTEKH